MRPWRGLDVLRRGQQLLGRRRLPSATREGGEALGELAHGILDVGLPGPAGPHLPCRPARARRQGERAAAGAREPVESPRTSRSAIQSGSKTHSYRTRTVRASSIYGYPSMATWPGQRSGDIAARCWPSPVRRNPHRQASVPRAMYVPRPGRGNGRTSAGGTTSGRFPLERNRSPAASQMLRPL